MQRTRRLSLASTAVLLVAFTSGCLMPRKPPPPPFRVEPYGAGFERGSNGKLVTVADDEGTTIGRMRVTRHSLRMQSTEAVPMGRVRVHASEDEATGQWEYIGRDASLRCVREALPTQAGQEAFTIQCGEDGEWVFLLSNAGVHIHGDETPEWLPTADAAASLEIDRIQWSSHSLGLIRHAFTTHDAGAPARFAALTLAAWELREWQADENPPTHNDTADNEATDAAEGADAEGADAEENIPR